MNDLINISLGDAGVTALLGYMVVFLGLVLLMCVVMIMGRIMVGKANKAKTAAPAAAPGTGGRKWATAISWCSPGWTT